MMKQSLTFVVLLVLGTGCGSSAKKAASPLPSPSPSIQSPPSRSDNAACGTLGILAVPAPSCEYQAVDTNTVTQVCNQPNVIINLHPDCYYDPSLSYCSRCTLSPNLAGTWVPFGVSAARVTAAFDCKGQTAYPTVWSCQQQSMTITFVDNTSQTFSATEAQELDPNNHLRSMELDNCDPVSMDTDVPGVNGGRAALSLGLPLQNFVPGLWPIQISGGTNPNAVDVGVSYGSYVPGNITAGTIDFTATALDTNERLAFTLDANMAAPSSDTQQGTGIIYCGQPTAYYYGKWLGFVQSSP